MLALETERVEDTREVGAALASLLRPGDVVTLTGEPGAGKTSLVQGAARGLGVTAHVVSPTFTLVREYDGDALHVYHLDVYRLQRVQDVIDLGFEEIVDSGGVTFIEWGDVIEGLLDGDYLEVELTVPDVRSERRAVRVSAVGASWRARMDAVAGVTDRWAAS